MPNLYVRSFETKEAVSTVPLKSTDERHVDKVIMGLLRNMDLEKFYIDRSELEKNNPQ